jgi:hypothetical protein
VADRAVQWWIAAGTPPTLAATGNLRANVAPRRGLAIRSVPVFALAQTAGAVRVQPEVGLADSTVWGISLASTRRHR